MSPREWEAYVRKQNVRTAEDQFMDEVKERGATDGRMLRNRKVVDISSSVKLKKRKAVEDEQGDCEVSRPTDELQRPTLKAAKKSKYTHGLPSPSSTPSGNSALNSSNILDSHNDDDDDDNVIYISSRTPTPAPTQSLRHPTEIISTRWVHPVHFLTMQMQCSFCKNDLFGVFGHDERVVTVERIDMGNKCYREISGGHAAEGKQSTTMCARCSIKRYFMACCSQHRLKRLPDLESDKLDLNKANMDKYTAQLLDGDAQSKKLKMTQKTCSICPCPASFQCDTKQPRTPTGIRLPAGKELEGCGLLVCTSCRKYLEGNQGVVSRSAFWARQKYGEYPLRADFEFLIEGSLLHRAVHGATAARMNKGDGNGAERP
jgi:hypothetical protein